MRRNSLTNMLGEFVGFNRSPGAILSSSSNQELNHAVKEEKRNFMEQESVRPEKRKPRQRYLSEGDIRVVSSHPVSVSELKRGIHSGERTVTVSSNPAGDDVPVDVTMRSKKPKRGDRPTSLIERIRRKISYTKTGAIIESDEEKDHIEEKPAGFPKRRDSTRSEKLFIPITPVEAIPIRIVQVTN